MNADTAHAADLLLSHRLADAAATISLAYFRRDLRSWSKSDGSLATDADLAVEDEVRRLLGAERPGDAMLGEERGQTGSSGRKWVVDGIDGTIEFASGSPEWGTLIALEIDGRVVVGICDEPAHGRRYWAVKDGGAWSSSARPQAPERLHVSGVRDLRSARSYVPPPRWRRNEHGHAFVDRLASSTRPEPHVNHPAIQVAAGGYELAVFLLAGPWDLAAPALIVEEAGGRFTDLGGRHDLTSGTALFSNGHLHDGVLQLVLPALRGVDGPDGG